MRAEASLVPDKTRPVEARLLVIDNCGRSLHFAHPAFTVMPRLTARELQVLKGVACGYSNPKIAVALRISVDGVKYHLKVIFGKLGATGRLQAVRIAEQCGLLTVANAFGGHASGNAGGARRWI